MIYSYHIHIIAFPKVYKYRIIHLKIISLQAITQNKSFVEGSYSTLVSNTGRQNQRFRVITITVYDNPVIISNYEDKNLVKTQ